MGAVFYCKMLRGGVPNCKCPKTSCGFESQTLFSTGKLVQSFSKRGHENLRSFFKSCISGSVGSGGIRTNLLLLMKVYTGIVVGKIGLINPYIVFRWRNVGILEMGTLTMCWGGLFFLLFFFFLLWRRSITYYLLSRVSVGTTWTNFVS